MADLPLDRAALQGWLQKWRWYHRPRRPWNVARLHLELARRQAFARGALHGNALQMLREGRLTIGPNAYFEPGVWLTSDTGRITIGGGSLLNLNVMVAAVERVEIGAHCMLANGCLLTDGDHRFDDPGTPVPWQGFTTKGPVVLGDNVWLGAHVVVTSGVTIGRRELGRDGRRPRVRHRGGGARPRHRRRPALHRAGVRARPAAFSPRRRTARCPARRAGPGRRPGR